MSRRLPAAFALVAVAAISLTACSGTPSAPALTTPDDIITAALKSTEGAKSFHADATVDGNLSGDLMGSGTSQSFNLAGTTASADVDLANKAVHASFAVPALLGLSGDADRRGPEGLREDLADRSAVHGQRRQGDRRRRSDRYGQDHRQRRRPADAAGHRAGQGRRRRLRLASSATP